MAEDKAAILAALRNGQDAMPFGVGGPAEPQAWAPDVIGSVGSAVANIPKHLIDASAGFDPNDIHGSTARVVPAAADTAMALAGMGAPAAEAGAAGIFGGKLSPMADIKMLQEADTLHRRGFPQAAIRDNTGWFMSPTDRKWRFEIPDDKSRIIGHGLDYSQDGSFVKGPASAILDHSDLYRAYPELKDTTIYNSVLHNPRNGIGTGMWDRGNLTAEVNAPNLENARSVALHEMQHAVQDIEHFATGGNPSRMAYLKEKQPQKLPFHDQTADPNDLYTRLAGEVESRNVQTRANMGPRERNAVLPWNTQDTAYHDQLVYNPQTDFVRALRNLK